jgi:hypothetical protein
MNVFRHPASLAVTFIAAWHRHLLLPPLIFNALQVLLTHVLHQPTQWPCRLEQQRLRLC